MSIELRCAKDGHTDKRWLLDIKDGVAVISTPEGQEICRCTPGEAQRAWTIPNEREAGTPFTIRHNRQVVPFNVDAEGLAQLRAFAPKAVAKGPLTIEQCRKKSRQRYIVGGVLVVWGVAIAIRMMMVNVPLFVAVVPAGMILYGMIQLYRGVRFKSVVVRADLACDGHATAPAQRMFLPMEPACVERAVVQRPPAPRQAPGDKATGAMNDDSVTQPDSTSGTTAYVLNRRVTIGCAVAMGAILCAGGVWLMRHGPDRHESKPQAEELVRHIVHVKSDLKREAVAAELVSPRVNALKDTIRNTDAMSVRLKGDDGLILTCIATQYRVLLPLVAESMNAWSQWQLASGAADTRMFGDAAGLSHTISAIDAYLVAQAKVVECCHSFEHEVRKRLKVLEMNERKVDAGMEKFMEDFGPQIELASLEADAAGHIKALCLLAQAHGDQMTVDATTHSVSFADDAINEQWKSIAGALAVNVEQQDRLKRKHAELTASAEQR